MERSVEDRLFSIADGIRVLLAEARAISDACRDRKDFMPYLNIHRFLAEAGLACCEAIEQEREASHA